MKLLVPVTCPNDVEVFSAAGADEYYFGFLDPGLAQASRAHLLWNRRPFPEVNFLKAENVFEAIGVAHGRDATMFLALNQLWYSPGAAPAYPGRCAALL